MCITEHSNLNLPCFFSCKPFPPKIEGLTCEFGHTSVCVCSTAADTSRNKQFVSRLLSLPWVHEVYFNIKAVTLVIASSASSSTSLLGGNRSWGPGRLAEHDMRRPLNESADGVWWSIWHTQTTVAKMVVKGVGAGRTASMPSGDLPQSHRLQSRML